MTAQSDIQLGPYRLLELVGDGGMGEVWKAVHQYRPGAPMAVKVMRRAAGSDAVRRAIHEGRIGLGLHHPNIVQTFDVGFSGGTAYVVLELLRGATLAEICPLPGEPLPCRAAAAVALQVLAGLQYAHASLTEDGRPLELVHDDIKPSNLFLTDEGTIKLLDFGISSARTQGPTSQRGGAGTPAYMAPERVRARPGDAKSDLFALALVIAELVSGEPAHELPEDAGIHDADADGGLSIIGVLPADVPSDFQRWLSIALRPDPRHRFATAGEMARALRACILDPWTAPALAAWYRGRPRLPRRVAAPRTRWLDREPGVAAVFLSAAMVARARSTESDDPRDVFSREHTIRAPLASSDCAMVSEPPVPTTERVPLARPRRRWTTSWGAAAAVLLVAAAVTGAAWATQRDAGLDAPQRTAARLPAGRAAAREDGWMSVHAVAPRTRVRVAGKDVGQAPLFRHPVMPGVYLVEAIRPDGRRLTQRVRVEPGRGTRVSFP
jgi:serine/threonine-protein kinase